MARGAERKRRQVARAAETGDVTALERLASREPSRAVQPCIALLEGEAPREALRVAASLAGRLRRDGRTTEALQVAGAGARRTRRLRLEEALSAFALGDDARAIELCHMDSVVSAIVSPLVAASSGETTKRQSGGPRKGPHASALHAVASAVGHARRGDAQGARRALGRVPRALRSQVAWDAMHAATTLAVRMGGSAEANKRLGSVPVDAILAAVGTPKHDPILETLAREASSSAATAQAARTAYGAASIRGWPRELAERASLVHASDLSPGTLGRRILDVGVAVFPDDERGTAALYEGYALLDTDRRGARQRLSGAIEHGAEIAEALRGLRIASLRDLMGATTARAERAAAQEFSTLSDRLERELDRTPGGAVMAVATTVETAVDLCRVATGSEADGRDLEEHARRWAEHARRRVGELVKQDCRSALQQLDLAEGTLLFCSEPRRALELAERMLERDRKHESAWLLKFSASHAQGLPIDTWIGEAAALTKSPVLQKAARAARQRAGTLAPFEGLAPGAQSPGTVGQELLDALSRLGERGAVAESDVVATFTVAAAHRASLSADDRIAVDAAFLVGVRHLDGADLAAPSLRLVIEDLPDGYGSAAEALGSLFCHFHEGRFVNEVVQELASSARGKRYVADVLRAIAGALGTRAAERILLDVAPALDRSTLHAAKEALFEPLERLTMDILDDVHDALEPEMCIHAVVEMGPQRPAPISLDRTGQVRLDGEWTPLEELLDFLGVAPGRASELSAEDRVALISRVQPILDRGPSGRSRRELADVLASYGLFMSGSRLAPKMPSLNQQERNRRKRDRKKGRRR